MIEKRRLRFVDGVQPFPFLPLRLALGDLRVELRIDHAQRNAVLHVRHELALLPDRLLEGFRLGEEVDHLAGRHLHQLQNLEPAPGPAFGGDRVSGLHAVDVQHFVFQVEIELAGEKAFQVLVDEKVRGVAPSVAAHVVLKQGHWFLAVAVALCGDGGERGGVKMLGQIHHRLRDKPFLQMVLAVLRLVRACRGTIFERNVQLPCRLLPLGLPKAREEIALVALDVALLHVGVHHGEAHLDLAGLEGVVAEVFAGLNVVLVLVGPVQMHFLAVVGDGVALATGVAAFGNDVAVVVVAAEEAVQVLIEGGLGRADVRPLRHMPLLAASQAEVALAERRLVEGRLQVAVAVEGLGAKGLANLLLHFAHLLSDHGLFEERPLGEFVLNELRQVLSDVALHHVPLVVHDAVDAEVQIRAVELEQLAQQGLEPRLMFAHGSLQQ